MIGQTLTHYRIESKLGQGGMGVVYRALDTHLDRPVAIKLLPPEAVANPERKRRFVQEAKAASALNHPITPLDLPLSVTIEGFSLHPDGKSFATTVGTARWDIWLLEGFPQPRGWSFLR
jgi:serine/threonine protein kinase